MITPRRTRKKRRRCDNVRRWFSVVCELSLAVLNDADFDELRPLLQRCRNQREDLFPKAPVPCIIDMGLELYCNPYGKVNVIRCVKDCDHFVRLTFSAVICKHKYNNPDYDNYVPF